MAITDLIGYTWIGNDIISSDDFQYYINFTSGSGTYHEFCLMDVPKTELYYIGEGLITNTVYYANLWINDTYKIINITGGDDSTDTYFISWLEANGTLLKITPKIKNIQLPNGDVYEVGGGSGMALVENPTSGDVLLTDENGQAYDSGYSVEEADVLNILNSTSTSTPSDASIPTTKWVENHGYDDTSVKNRLTTIENKEAGWDAKYSKPSSGIPKTDLASEVQTSLSKADTALQTHQSLQNLGCGYGTCSTSASTRAKTVSLTNYVLVTGGMVSVKFTYDVPANATLNINSRGAKNIRYEGANITADIITAGDIATFVYDGTYYNLTGVDRLPSNDNTPIGTITPFGGSTIPSGWLECNGAAVSRTVYAQLFSVIGTTFGSGDGSTTFNLPNISGKTLVGRQASDTDFDALGDTGGEKTHTLTIAEMPSHQHYLGIGGTSWWSNAHDYKPNTVTSAYNYDAGYYYSSYPGNGHIAWAEGGSGAHNNMQPYIVTNFIIKATSESGDVPVSPTIEQRIAAIENQISRVENYTTQEQLIGTWIDGKPLYRKFVEFGTLPNSTSEERPHNISNVKHIHINQGKTFWVQNQYSYTDNDGYAYIAPYGTYIVNMAVSKTRIYINNNVSDATNYKLLVCLEYTKTTD